MDADADVDANNFMEYGEFSVLGMALELLLLEGPSEFSERNACYALDIKP